MAFRDVPGITVAAGILGASQDAVNGTPLSQAVPEPDSTQPEVVSSTQPDPSAQLTGSRKRKSSSPKKWDELHKKSNHGNETKESSPETDKHCCMFQMAHQLAQKYGVPTPYPNGTASAPRLMIQYPGLPYMVPVNQEFNNIGIPRECVKLCGNTEFWVRVEKISDYRKHFLCATRKLSFNLFLTKKIVLWYLVI